MEVRRTDTPQAEVVDHRALAVALLEISSHVRRRSHQGTGIPPLSSGVLDILRVIDDHPGITVAEVAARLGRQMSNVSTALRELVALGLVTRGRETADKRCVTLRPTAESLRIKTLLESVWAGDLAAGTSRLLPAERAQIQASLPALKRLASVLADLG
ncbi:MarR family winged helix-turn-helix transcriptional regulator [Nonomuraea sp. 3N208]|uniref:MarR family winged helix-turn-helix transcriptional regulator n=1 Tax=Nonomuraea sp. 3N208 TaxID=3457421 RepID=UPI003FCC85F2